MRQSKKTIETIEENYGKIEENHGKSEENHENDGKLDRNQLRKKLKPVEKLMNSANERF